MPLRLTDSNKAAIFLCDLDLWPTIYLRLLLA